MYFIAPPPKIWFVPTIFPEFIQNIIILDSERYNDECINFTNDVFYCACISEKKQKNSLINNFESGFG